MLATLSGYVMLVTLCCYAVLVTLGGYAKLVTLGAFVTHTLLVLTPLQHVVRGVLHDTLTFTAASI